MAMRKTLSSEEKKNIIEFNGPPMAYIRLSDGHNTVFLRHWAYSFQGSREWCEQKMKEVVDKAKELLPDGGTIIWRNRPKVDEAPHGQKSKGSYSSYCRFTTSPPLPESFFATFGHIEGAPPRTE